MLYNIESPPERKKKIICPIITVWIVFILKVCLEVIFLNIEVYDINSNFYKYSFNLGLIFALCDFICTLFASFFVTLSFAIRKFWSYLTGLIIVGVLALSMTKYFPKPIDNSDIIISIFVIIHSLLLAVDIIVLSIYLNKVKNYFSDSDPNNNNNNNSNSDLSLEINPEA